MEKVKKQKSSNSFLKGAAILGIAAIVIKVIGATFRIPLANKIGDLGMGYYQSAYPIYIYLSVIATAGIPTAIAKIVSEKVAIGDHIGANRILKVSLSLMMVVGGMISLALIFSAPTLAHYVKNEKAVYSMYAIAPAIFFVSIMSVFRGYFQGYQRMEAYAWSQVIEQFARVTVGLSLAFMLVSKGLEFSAAGATFGATVGGIVGSILIFVLFIKYKNTGDFTQLVPHDDEASKSIVKRLMMVAIPITIGASILPVMTVFDLAIVMRRLNDIGYMGQDANRLYGQLTGYAQTVVNLPQVITAAVQISIVPAISQFVTLGDKVRRDDTIEAGIRLALIIGLPSSVGLVLLSEGIMKLLYPMQMNIASNTGAVLGILGWGVVFLSMFQITTGILQGIGKQSIPMKNLFFSAILKAVLSYVLVGVAVLNIKGAAIATVSAYALAAILNFTMMVKETKITLSFKNVFLKPIISVAVMGLAVKLTYIILALVVSDRMATALAVVIGGGSYFIMLFVTNTLTDKDLEMMPGGSKLK
ncbi:MAG: polysaccharide biosynthesis protein, partial [Acidaminobacteraceae bacterium]